MERLRVVRMGMRRRRSLVGGQGIMREGPGMSEIQGFISCLG